jgi:hypothetical protein
MVAAFARKFPHTSMVSVMQESASDSTQQVLTKLRDLRDVPLSSVRTNHVDEVNVVVRRMVDDALVSSKPPVAAFQSLI